MSPLQVGQFEPNQLWQQAIEPIFWLDPALSLSWVNRAWEQLTGYPADRVLGLNCLDHTLTHPGDPIELAASFRPPPEALAGQPSGIPTLIVHASGESRSRRLEFWPFRDQDQTLIGLLGLVRPVDCPPCVPETSVSPIHLELLETRRRLQTVYGFDNLIGFGPAHRRLLEQVRVAAASTAPVLIVGETGTGKQHVARTIHQEGPGRLCPLVPFDCEALPAEILERDLFAVERKTTRDMEMPAALTASPKPRLSVRDGSTLLLREIAKLPRDLQARLVASLDSSVRLVATTALDPDTARQNDLIRSDLYFALTTLVIRLQPLRERRDELPIMAQHFLERANLRGGVVRSGFTPQVISALMSYDWPGNLSELARVIDHAHAQQRSERPLISLEDLPASIQGHSGAGFPPPLPACSTKSLDEFLAEVERRLIETALRQTRSNKSRAAEILGISRPRLYRRIKELNLPDENVSMDEIETHHETSAHAKTEKAPSHP